MTSASTTEALDSQDSPLLHRPKLSQNGKELTIGKNNHTYQNTNLITTGKCSSKLSSSIGVAIDSTSTSVLGGNPLSCKSSRVSALSFDGTVSYENLNMDYISQLCSEGFQQSRVIRALGITRNDLAMARDILQEFTQPSST